MKERLVVINENPDYLTIKVFEMDELEAAREYYQESLSHLREISDEPCGNYIPPPGKMVYEGQCMLVRSSGQMYFGRADCGFRVIEISNPNEIVSTDGWDPLASNPIESDAPSE